MAWDFETDPDYQELLDWADAFVRDEVEPLDLVLGDPYDKTDPRYKRLVRPSRTGCGRRAWAATSAPTSAARDTAR